MLKRLVATLQDHTLAHVAVAHVAVAHVAVKYFLLKVSQIKECVELYNKRECFKSHYIMHECTYH